MSRIADAFARCREEGRAAFIPYITAGDPSLAASREIVRAIAASGADLVELGVAFSDPIADGPVNQRAAFRALAGGVTLDRTLGLVGELRAAGVTIPLVLFSYFNPIHARGVAAFAASAAAAGVDGVLVVDLPPEEAGELSLALRGHGLDLIVLLAPTSTAARLRAAAQIASGFVYYVSRTGVTGEQTALPVELGRELRRVRRSVSLPIAVGFGISTAAQVTAVGQLADGVVVGSALVRLIEELGQQLAAEPKPDQTRSLDSGQGQSAPESFVDVADLAALVGQRVRELTAGLAIVDRKDS